MSRTPIVHGEIYAKDYGAKGDGTTDDTAALQAAINAGDPGDATTSVAVPALPVRVPPGRYRLLGNLTIPAKVDFRGSGVYSTIFSCEAAGAGITFLPGPASTPAWSVGFGGFGGSSGDFYVDGTNVATLPLDIGKIVQRTLHDIAVQRSAGTGCRIGAAQNSLFSMLNVENNAGSNVLIDAGAGGNMFQKCEWQNPGRYALEIVEGRTSPITAYTAPSDNTFYACILERLTTVGALGLLYVGAGSNLMFDRCNFAGGSSAIVGPAVKVRKDGASAVSIWFANCNAQGSDANTTCYDIQGSVVVQFTGIPVTQHGIVGIAMDDTATVLATGQHRYVSLGSEYTTTGTRVQAQAIRSRIGGKLLENLVSTQLLQHAGSPEGVVTAGPGAICTDTTNGEIYIKNTGTGNTGWKLITRAA